MIVSYLADGVAVMAYENITHIGLPTGGGGQSDWAGRQITEHLQRERGRRPELEAGEAPRASERSITRCSIHHPFDEKACDRAQFSCPFLRPARGQKNGNFMEYNGFSWIFHALCPNLCHTMYRHKENEMCDDDQAICWDDVAPDLSFIPPEMDVSAAMAERRWFEPGVDWSDVESSWDLTEADLIDPDRPFSSLLATFGYIYEDWKHIDPHNEDKWREWRNAIWVLLDDVGDESSAQAPAVQTLALIADVVGDSYRDVLEALRALRDRYHDTQRQASELEGRVNQLEEQAASLRRDNRDLEEEIARLKAARARPPRKAKVVIPSRTVVIRSAAQQQAMRSIGDEGLGRSWRIARGIVQTQGLEENSARNALTALTKKGLIDDYRRDGKSIRWKYAAGGSRRLVVLTERGKTWYQEVYGREPVESEILQAARQHRSAVHGVGVLEARDHLRALGHRVDDAPEAILAQDGSRWGRRQEPDLVVWMDGQSWPVEVQREVSQRLLDKWEKALALNERLALILFNVEHREKQEALLRQDKRVRGLRRGIIRLTSLEEMETGNWGWTVLNLPFRR